METRAHHVVIGLFVVLAAVGGLLFALWLNQSTRDQAYTQYEVLFNHGVSGLSEGNAVEYSGVRVGDVVSLRLDPADPRNVLALIRVQSQVPIRQNTRARLALANITGSMSIQLQGGAPESPLLITRGDTPPRITADQSPLSAMLSDSEELLGNVNRVLTRLEEVLSEENVASIERTLANLERTTAQFAALGDAPGQLAERMLEVSEEAARTLAEVRALAGRTGGLVQGQAEEVLGNARQITSSLARTAQSLETLLDDNQGALESGLRGVQGLGPATLELRNTLSSLNRLVRRLEENPRDFLLGRDRVEEFTP
ncbi:MCE family protein [Halomonas sp. MCCC 1A11036]|uniref:MCE family protein n=1 Tax=Billgrantia zhangzhouensis TaxID=2733481 RepID=A0ABS9ABQ6_9GAMM|nr:MlaD family protein [Halomonas zhangzhouensis]MCE8019139.1 MCE family protein [Halomonas zhangzhouensis]